MLRNMLKNNLLNVTVEDEIYHTIWRHISRHIPEVEDERFKIIAVDCYFLHYSLNPKIADGNEDERLEEVRRVLERYVRSKEYRRIKPITTLDEDMILIHAIALLRELKRSDGDLEYALRRANEVTRNANDLRELAGVSVGVERLIRLVDVDVEVIATAKRMLREIPFTVKIGKRRDRIGEEIAGYTLTRRVERALPREFALPEELFLRRLETGFLSKEMLNVEEGTYYVLLDVSGSMRGEKIVWAKSVAMALHKIAMKKGSAYILRTFNDGVSKAIDDPVDVVEYLLRAECGGGTNIDLALATAIDDRPDTIVLITDGKDRVSDWRGTMDEREIELISVMIGGHNEELRRISDRYMRVEPTIEHGVEVLRVVDIS